MTGHLRVISAGLGTSVQDAGRFGVAEISPDSKIVSIEEKPKNPKSNFAVIGVYLYDHTVFDVISGLKP